MQTKRARKRTFTEQKENEKKKTTMHSFHSQAGFGATWWLKN